MDKSVISYSGCSGNVSGDDLHLYGNDIREMFKLLLRLQDEGYRNKQFGSWILNHRFFYQWVILLLSVFSSFYSLFDAGFIWHWTYAKATWDDELSCAGSLSLQVHKYCLLFSFFFLLAALSAFLVLLVLVSHELYLDNWARESNAWTSIERQGSTAGSLWFRYRSRENWQ